MKSCLPNRFHLPLRHIQGRHVVLARPAQIARPVPLPLRSVSKSTEVEGTASEAQAKNTDEQEEVKFVEGKKAIDVEATPVVAAESKPETTEPAVEAPAAEAQEPSPGPLSHRLEDVPAEEEDLIGSKELVSEVMDGSAFGKRGEQWLFAQLAVVAMVLFPPLTLKGLVDFCATVSLTAGLVFILTALFTLGRNISPLPEPRKKHQLVVSGIYGYVRHPMYGGLLLAAFGLAVLTRNETRVALVALLWWVLEKKLAREERALSARYPEYAEYKAKVKKFFPFIY